MLPIDFKVVYGKESLSAAQDIRCHVVSRSNLSHEPIAVRFAISGAAPAFSAATYRLLPSERSETLPSLLRMTWNVSAGPIDVRFAISGAAAPP